MEESPAPSERTRLHRASSRSVYDRKVIYEILDEALLCHVGIQDQGQPFVLPMLHFRLGDRLCVHGSTGSRLMQNLGAGTPACLTVTLLDGLVLARSLFHHAANYRSVVVLGKGTAISEPSEKMQALKRLTDHVVPGRWEDARQPSEAELAATLIVGFPLDECSAKVRGGPPQDAEADYELPFWAGVVPLPVTPSEPIADPRGGNGIPVPPYLTHYARTLSRR